MSSILEKVRYISNDNIDAISGETPEFIATEDDYRDAVLFGSKTKVHKYGVDLLDEYVPFKGAQLTTIVGLPNVGKTTTILWMIVKLVHESNLNFTIHSSENPVAEVVELLIEFHFGIPRPLMSDPMVRQGLDWVNEHFRFIKNNRTYTYSQMIRMFSRSLDTGFDSEFFLDPYNGLKLELKGLSKPDYNTEACAAFKIFTDITGKSLMLNCHTNTEATRKRDEKNKNNTPRPLASDVEGGLPFISKPDDVMVIHRHIRDNENFMLTEVYVDKVRNQKHGGKITPYDSPIKLRFRIDRSGYDVDGSYEEKINTVKARDAHLAKHGIPGKDVRQDINPEDIFGHNRFRKLPPDRPEPPPFESEEPVF